MTHGNTGFKVKNLRGTKGCPHYRGYGSAADSDKKCAWNGCSGRAIRACHVIAANQNEARGRRFLVYMCASCNANYTTLSIRLNAIEVEIMCDCPVTL